MLGSRSICTYVRTRIIESARSDNLTYAVAPSDLSNQSDDFAVERERIRRRIRQVITGKSVVSHRAETKTDELRSPRVAFHGQCVKIPLRPAQIAFASSLTEIIRRTTS